MPLLTGSNVDTSAVLRVLPGAEELFSEFQGFTGDCGEFAELSTTHIVAGINLTPDNLNTIVHREIDHGWASANGGEPLSSIVNDLNLLELHNTPYNYPGPDNWLQILKENAGSQPVIMELANGQNLAGDEKGLHYHFITIVGILDNGNFLCCDGDNLVRDNEHILCEYTASMLDGATPCGLIVVKYPQQDPWGYTVQKDGSIIYNTSKIHLIGAVADFVQKHNVQEECLHAEQYYKGSDWSVTPFSNGVVIVWDNVDKTILLNHAGEVIASLLG